MRFSIKSKHLAVSKTRVSLSQESRKIEVVTGESSRKEFNLMLINLIPLLLVFENWMILLQEYTVFLCIFRKNLRENDTVTAFIILEDKSKFTLLESVELTWGSSTFYSLPPQLFFLYFFLKKWISFFLSSLWWWNWHYLREH